LTVAYVRAELEVRGSTANVSVVGVVEVTVKNLLGKGKLAVQPSEVDSKQIVVGRENSEGKSADYP
jgi:hypothetical protein